MCKPRGLSTAKCAHAIIHHPSKRVSKVFRFNHREFQNEVQLNGFGVKDVKINNDVDDFVGVAALTDAISSLLLLYNGHSSNWFDWNFIHGAKEFYLFIYFW